jgi:hypothetical protein
VPDTVASALVAIADVKIRTKARAVDVLPTFFIGTRQMVVESSEKIVCSIKP